MVGKPCKPTHYSPAPRLKVDDRTPMKLIRWPPICCVTCFMHVCEILFLVIWSARNSMRHVTLCLHDEMSARHAQLRRRFQPQWTLAHLGGIEQRPVRADTDVREGGFQWTVVLLSFQCRLFVAWLQPIQESVTKFLVKSATLGHLIFQRNILCLFPFYLLKRTRTFVNHRPKE